MENDTLQHRMNETYKAAPLPLEDCGLIRIQIKTEKGATKWLSITPDEFRHIERVLAGQKL